MHIERVIIQNYRTLQNTDIQLNSDLNIIVGNNESGKSTLLEAINLALNCQLNRRPALYELHPYLFNVSAISQYLAEHKNGNKIEPPSILIELYFADEPDVAELKGTHNSRNENACGISLSIELDFATFSGEYKDYISDPDALSSIPVEYYHIVWDDFGGNPIRAQAKPVHCALVDPSAITNNYAAHKYVLEIIKDYLTKKQRVDLALSYRKMKDIFLADDNVSAINEALKQKSGEVSEKDLSVSLDTTTRASWETGVIPHLNDIPLPLIGKGEQNSVKIKLAVEAEESCHILLLEEPENHLTHVNLNKLLSHLNDRLEGKQVILTTHSSFVLNKLGIEKTIMFDGESGLTISDLPPSTERFFKKAPGHDTLRMILAPKTILVEGPSDELILHRAYSDLHGDSPLENGVEIISVRSLAFKRFLDIAQKLNLDVTVVTDNDGDPQAVTDKYNDYTGPENENISVCFSEDQALETLEPQLLAANSLEAFNTIFGKTYGNQDSLLKHMKNNKAECALLLLETDKDVTMPDYILNAVQ